MSLGVFLPLQLSGRYSAAHLKDQVDFIHDHD